MNEAATLRDATDHGGLMSFRYVVALCRSLMLVFGGMLLAERRSGQYRIERI